MLQKEEECKITHSLQMMSNLEDLLKSNIVCDFLINIGKSSFPAHKAVLAACSEYFRFILAEGIDQGVIYINGVSPDAMEQCIRFMYTGEADISLSNTESVLNAADLFQIEALMDLCYDFIRNNLTPSNCLSIRNMVVVFENRKFRETVDRFIVDKMDEVVDTDTFKRLQKQDMKYFLKMWRSTQRGSSAPVRELRSATHTPRIFLSSKSRSLVGSAKSCKSPMSKVRIDKREIKTKDSLLWKGVVSWVSHDPSERGKEFLELLRFIKVTRFTINFLSTTVWNEVILSENTSVKEFIASKVLTNIGEVKSSLNLRNCLNLFSIVTSFCKESYDRYLKTVVGFMAAHLKQIKARSEIESWTLDEFCLFFNTCDCSVLEESDIWDTALTWLQTDKEREADFLDVLKVLHIEDFSPKFVISSILKVAAVRSSADSVKYISDVVFKDTRHIIWNTTVDTCFTLKHLSRRYKNTAFARVDKELVSFIVTNFLKVMEHPEFTNLTFEELLLLGKILRKRNVHGEATWIAVMKWVRYDPDLRRRHLLSLLKIINFERLTTKFLKGTVRSESLVAKSSECHQFVMTEVYNKLP